MAITLHILLIHKIKIRFTDSLGSHVTSRRGEEKPNQKAWRRIITLDSLTAEHSMGNTYHLAKHVVMETKYHRS